MRCVAERPLVAVVLEDDAAVRQLLDAILQTLGWERVLGASWDEVAPATRWADLLLVDHRLPGRSGLEVIADMKARRPELKVIMLTGDRTAQERAEHLGVDGFLLKPFDVSELIELVSDVGRPTIDLRPSAIEEPALEVRAVETPWFASN